MNFKRFEKYIVVDEENRPMTFYDGQFCYNDTHNSRRPFAIQLYTHKEAIELIKQTVKYRTKHYFSIGTYNLMPVNNDSLSVVITEASLPE